ncbi:MAG TPA: DUF2917 domain-containing protein, partial [Burkholderiaceae bacterium]|nr:DUF2917 domain-containing protein [Burkholderiaceae bacterium]
MDTLLLPSGPSAALPVDVAAPSGTASDSAPVDAAGPPGTAADAAHVDVAAPPGTASDSAPSLPVVVPPGRALRLSRPQGATLRVDSGRVWVTQTGCPHDGFPAAGESIALADSGVVVIETLDPRPATLRLLPSAAPAPSRGRRWLGRAASIAATALATASAAIGPLNRAAAAIVVRRRA